MTTVTRWTFTDVVVHSVNTRTTVFTRRTRTVIICQTYKQNAFEFRKVLAAYNMTINENTINRENVQLLTDVCLTINTSKTWRTGTFVSSSICFTYSPISTGTAVTFICNVQITSDRDKTWKPSCVRLRLVQYRTFTYLVCTENFQICSDKERQSTSKPRNRSFLCALPRRIENLWRVSLTATGL